MHITLVADESMARHGDCSRDPEVLAKGLSALGNTVAGPLWIPGRIEVDGLNGPYGPMQVMQPNRSTDVVLSMGTAAPIWAAVLSQTQDVPLVTMLPPDLLLPGSDLPSGYGRLICGHLPTACLIVESERQRLAAQQFGAVPHRIFRVPLGLEPPSKSALAPGGDELRRLRIVCDTWLTSPEEQSFLTEVLDRIGARREGLIDIVVKPRTGLRGYVKSDIVIVPDGGSYAALVAVRAMAAGRAVLAADTPAIRDVVTSIRHGVLARPGSTDEWVDKLEYLLSETALRTHLGRGAQMKAESDFSLHQALREIDVRLSSVTQNWNYP